MKLKKKYIDLAVNQTETFRRTRSPLTTKKGADHSAPIINYKLLINFLSLLR